MLDGSFEVERAVTLLFPAAKVSCAILKATAARHRHVFLEADEPVLQRNYRCGKLERRARRVASLDRFVDERPAFVFQQLLVVVGGNSAREFVWIPAWCTVQRQHLAGGRIDCDSTALQGVRENADHELLEIQIDVRVQRRSAYWIEVGSRTFSAHRTPTRVDLVEANAFLAVKNRLVLLLEPRFPDLLSRLVVRVLRVV